MLELASQPFCMHLECERGVKRKTPLQQSVKAFLLVGAEGVEPPTLCL